MDGIQRVGIALLLIAASGVTVVVGPAMSSSPPPAEDGRLTRRQAAADLRQWEKRVRLVHPEPWRAADLGDRVERVIARLPPTVSPLVLWQHAATLAATLGDSHTFVEAPPSDARLALPLLATTDGELYLRAAVGSLPAGVRIETLGGRSAAWLRARSSLWVGAPDPARAAAVWPSFIPVALELDGARRPWRVTGVDEMASRSRPC